VGELAVSLLRLGYLVALWAVVLVAITTLRRDVYGTTISRRGRAGKPKAKNAPVVAAPGVPGSPVAQGPARPAGPLARRSVELSPEAPTRLIVTSGQLRGTQLPLSTGGVVIGRSASANLVLDDEFASSRHAQLVLNQGQWQLEDLGSTNGTFFANKRMTGPVMLKDGSSFRIGNTTLEVRR